MTGRRPPAAQLGGQRIEFRGQFEHASNNGWASIVVVPWVDGASVQLIGGTLPGTCRDLQGHTRTPGKDGAIGVDFQEYTGAAPISLSGSFSFTLRPRRQTLHGGLAPFVVKVRGTFYGNNVVGQVQGSSGKGLLYTGCRGSARFWARRWT